MFYFVFSMIGTRENAFQYYKNSSFAPSSDFDTKLFKDVILEPTCPHIASQNGVKSRLGGVLGPLGAVLGASWGLLGAS